MFSFNKCFIIGCCYRKMSLSPLVVSFVALATVSCVSSNALDDYVNTPDPHYNYKFLTTYAIPGVTVHALNLTSQKWKSDQLTTNPIWFHHLFISVPTNVVHPDTAFIIIGSGYNSDKLADTTDTEINRASLIARKTGSVVAVIKQIPNQPIVFRDDPNRTNRSEDAILAWTWKKFLENSSDPEIILLLPMTKAVVRGMDAVTSYIKGLTGDSIDKFMVAGRSKRGWTTWLTAAVDKRVIAIAPTVMDLLNMRQNLHHHYRSLGGWSFAFTDYYQVDITKDLDNPELARFQEIADPFAYNDRLSIPKLIITSSGDEFFLLDDSHYFFDKLQSPKHIRVTPNASHTAENHELEYGNLLADFYLNILEGAQIPNVTWVLSQTGSGGKISATTSRVPNSVTVLYARTADNKRRDFRLTVIDPVLGSLRSNPVFWHSLDATRISDLEYEADIHRPVDGWLAFFIQFTFTGVLNSTLTFTTEVNIIPDVFAVSECSGTSCRGKLV
ncbi:unnamed protein product [Candidula unifasciata]|uniref:Uncharacterized protein n=1 Tax=Candidula unifasciata TaxID=100452 RepID=A0A8S3ZUZ9_9EUPU|nr:unnamed protein product [Candidula unifasciata]